MRVEYRVETLSCQRKMNPLLILASQSPRRRELLSSLKISFEVDPARGFQEVAHDGRAPENLVLENAEGKAKEVAGRHLDALVLGVDTIGVYQGQVLEKPHDKADAHRMLSHLQGNTHTVLTGLCLIQGEKIVSHVESSEVTFLPLTDEEIENYIITGEPMDKAASYAVQGIGSLFVRKIVGDYFNVVGLPLYRLNLMLQEFDIHLLRDVK